MGHLSVGSSMFCVQSNRLENGCGGDVPQVFSLYACVQSEMRCA